MILRPKCYTFGDSQSHAAPNDQLLRWWGDSRAMGKQATLEKGCQAVELHSHLAYSSQPLPLCARVLEHFTLQYSVSARNDCPTGPCPHRPPRQTTDP
eukprot:SAG11_NODE_2959_length_2809_cov_3.641328_2_plen_98_part_00